MVLRMHNFPLYASHVHVRLEAKIFSQPPVWKVTIKSNFVHYGDSTSKQKAIMVVFRQEETQRVEIYYGLSRIFPS